MQKTSRFSRLLTLVTAVALAFVCLYRRMQKPKPPRKLLHPQ